MFSKKIHLASLVDLYVCPKPVVAELVHKQLLRDDQVESIRKAIESSLKGEGVSREPYSTWLAYSGITHGKHPSRLAPVVTQGILQRALFDLTLGHQVKSLQLHRYSEVHEVRSFIEGFFLEFGSDMAASHPKGLWWDGPTLAETPHSPWISERLWRDPDFFKLFDSWLADSDHLQGFLDNFEATTNTVNNPGDSSPVFSEDYAAEIVHFSQVRCLGKLLTRLPS